MTTSEQPRNNTDLDSAFSQIDAMSPPEFLVRVYGELAALGHVPAAEAATKIARSSTDENFFIHKRWESEPGQGNLACKACWELSQGRFYRTCYGDC